jgi:hypothetical protein
MYLISGHLLCGELARICVNCGIPLITLHILVECPHYAKAHLTFNFHGMLSDMLGDDFHSVSNLLAYYVQ